MLNKQQVAYNFPRKHTSNVHKRDTDTQLISLYTRLNKDKQSTGGCEEKKSVKGWYLHCTLTILM